MKRTTIIGICILIFLVGCSTKVPIGDIFIANVTYIMIIEYNGVEERFEDSFLWDTQIDCSTGQPIEYIPEPNFNEGDIYLNSTMKFFVGFEPLQYVDCGDYIFRGWFNTLDSYYIKNQDYNGLDLYKVNDEEG